MRIRKAIGTLLGLLLSAHVFAEDPKGKTEALLGRNVVYSGWFLGLPMAATEIHDIATTMPGFVGGIVLSDGSRIGFKAHGAFLRSARAIDAGTGPEMCDLRAGYGGPFVSPALFGTKAVHVALPLLAAMGNASYISQTEYETVDEDGERDFDRRVLDESTFFNLEPGIAVEVNMTRFVKIAVGGSYRFLYGLRLRNLDTDALNGPTFTFEATFGRF